MLSCVWNLRDFPDDAQGCQCPLVLCLHPQGFLRRGVRASGSYPRADQEIGVFRHMAPPTRLRLEFPHQTGLILRCSGKVRNPFQTKQGNRPSCCDHEGRRGSDEVVPGTRCSPRVRLICRGTFGVGSRMTSKVSHFKKERGISLETL